MPYDPNSHELALAFLKARAILNRLPSEEEIADLAQAIQDAVEVWFAERPQPGQLPAEPEEPTAPKE